MYCVEDLCDGEVVWFYSEEAAHDYARWLERNGHAVAEGYFAW